MSNSDRGRVASAVVCEGTCSQGSHYLSDLVGSEGMISLLTAFFAPCLCLGSAETAPALAAVLPQYWSHRIVTAVQRWVVIGCRSAGCGTHRGSHAAHTAAHAPPPMPVQPAAVAAWCRLRG